MSGHTNWEKMREERRLKLLAKPAVEYGDGPVFSEDRDQYFPDLQELIETYWDDGVSNEDALVFECTVELAHTPHLVDIVDEAWGDELEDWEGMSDATAKILEIAREEVAKHAPTVCPDYTKRLEFDFSDGGFIPAEFVPYNHSVKEL